MSTLAVTGLIAAHARVNWSADGSIMLRPRPLARAPGAFVLLPLLPSPPPVRALPAEVWTRIFDPLLGDEKEGYGNARTLMRVSKGFKVRAQFQLMALPTPG
jgi:hypothetical protein